MPRVELCDIRNFVCRGTELEVRSGELLVLIGPNGAGKTTLLNVIAGLVEYRGSVRFDGDPVDAVPARERRVGYVFQDLVLFPHLDVSKNVGYGLRARGHPRPDSAARVGELLEFLAISHLATRYPATLSGGEKQRVALARALAPRPEILLLDEPFSSLDPQTARFLRADLHHLQRDLGATTIFVTHDLSEAEELADRIAVVQDGRVGQIGPTEEVLFSPRGREVTDYIGAPNVLDCQSTRSLGHGLVEAECGGLCLVVPSSGEVIRWLILLPRDVGISPHRPESEVNVFAGTIRAITPLAGVVRVDVETSGRRIAAELPRSLFESMRLRLGSEVFVEIGLRKIRARS